MALRDDILLAGSIRDILFELSSIPRKDSLVAGPLTFSSAIGIPSSSCSLLFAALYGIPQYLEDPVAENHQGSV